MNRILNTLIFLTLLPLTAQEELPEAAPTPVPYDLQLRFYTWPLRGILHDGMAIPALPQAYLPGTAGPKEVILSRGGMSAPTLYRGIEPPVLIHAEKAGTHPETGAQLWNTRPLAKPAVPREWKQCVVVLFPDSQRPDGSWQTLPLEADELNVPKGGSRFLNTSRRSLVLEVNQKRQSLAPGESVILTGAGAGSDRVRLRLYGRNPRNQQVELIYTSSHWRKQDARNLYVIYTSGTERLKVLQLSPEDIEKEADT